MSKRNKPASSAPYHCDPTAWYSFHEIKPSKWTARENKMFEDCLALHDKDTPDRWFKVAAMLPGKTVADVIQHYKQLEDDISDIEAGLIPVPGYSCTAFTLHPDDASGESYTAKAFDHGRKKGVPWTEQEHRQFLLGLQKYGKGDWRDISHYFVVTRTPTQVASHAQKFFLRQLTGAKDKRRSSIHDITTVNSSDVKHPLSTTSQSCILEKKLLPTTDAVKLPNGPSEWRPQVNQGDAYLSASSENSSQKLACHDQSVHRDAGGAGSWCEPFSTMQHSRTQFSTRCYPN